MFVFLLIVQSLIALGLIIVILMQRSEGGGLAGGGSPSGLMTARGAADFLTRATTILATAFIGLSILLAALAAGQTSRTIDPSAVQAPAAPTTGAPPAVPGLPTNGSAAVPGAQAPLTGQPIPGTGNAAGIPIAQ